MAEPTTQVAEATTLVSYQGMAMFKVMLDKSFAAKATATAESDGLMSADDKAKLDGMGASSYLSDDEFIAEVMAE